MTALQNRNKWGTSSSSTNNNANATFDFGSGNHSNNTNNSALGQRTASIVRFQMPNVSSTSCGNKQNYCPPSSSTLALASSLSNTQQYQQQHQQHQVQQQASQESKTEAAPTQQENKGNIHAGLFSWLQEDSMFLTDEKIQEQNVADAESERKLREAPMPLRFFTAAEDMGGGVNGLEMVSKSIFGGVLEPSQNGNDGFGNPQMKRELQGDDGRGYGKISFAYHRVTNTLGPANYTCAQCVIYI